MENPLELQKQTFLGILEDRLSKLSAREEINKILWKKIADEINAVGPMVKKGYEWKRTFKCLRWKVDRKRQTNISLTSSERWIAALDRKVRKIRRNFVSVRNPSINRLDSYQKMCRICLSINESNKLINLFVSSITDDSSLSPIKKLKQLSPMILLEKDDGLPQSICESCFNSLDKAYTFKMLCESSDSLLRNGLNVKSELTVENDEIRYDSSTTTDLDEKEHCNRICKTDQHVEEHWNPPKYICSKCPFETNSRRYMRTHVKIHVDPNKSIQKCLKGTNTHCKECDKKFSSNSNMLKHTRQVHMNEKNYQCHECGFRLGDRNHFYDHYVATHAKIKQYKCPECEYAYCTAWGLKKHIRKCHPDIVYSTLNEFRKLTHEESEILMKANIKLKIKEN